MPELRIKLPTPLPWQQQVKRERRRFNVGAIGRRSGKTVLGQDLVCDPDVLPYPTAWFAPTYKDMLEVWREVRTVLYPIARRVSVQDWRIENIAGGVLEFWSMDNPKAGRGRKYKRVIIDECAFVPGLLDAWNYAIRPTLIDLRGDAYFFSTPEGRNGFYQLFQLAQHEGEWQAWQMPSSVNPHLAAEELESMRATLPERAYRQEMLAEFVADGGGVVRFVRDAVREMPGATHPQHTFGAGVDWALSVDRTAVVVIDASTGEVVAVDSFNGVEYALQRERIAALCRQWRVSSVVAESNAMGKPNNDELRRLGVPVRDFVTTNTTKADIIEELAAAFENRRITIPDHAQLIAELESLESSRTPAGLVRYAAPAGMHDDLAIALALAWAAANTRKRPIRSREY